MSRFTDFHDARDAGAVNLVWKHQLLDAQGTVLATTDAAEAGEDAIVWGAELRPLAFQGDRVSQRTATMNIPVNDARLMPDRAGTLIHPETGNRIRLHAGLVVNGEPQYQVQATMLADDVDATYDSGQLSLGVSLVDMIRPLRSAMITAFKFSDGASVSATVKRLVDQVVSGAKIASTGFTTPSGSIEAGSKRDHLVTQLLEGCGHELTTDALGNIFSRAILPSTGGDGERWRYGQADGIPIQSASRGWSVKVPQGWRVEGGSFQNQDEPVTVTVYDTDPSSEGYFQGEDSSQITTSRLPFVKSQSQGAVAGYAQLRRHGVGPMQISFTSVPNPSMREGDLVDFELDELNASGTYRVMAYNLPLQVDGLMSVLIRKIYDPAQGYQPTADGVTCTAFFSDDFDRDEQNLEHLDPGQAGSPNWTEHGWSWAVVDRKAIQRYENGWSFAQVVAPACSADIYATIEIEFIPGGRYCGPMICGSGGHDGYFAKCDNAGNVSLERWLNGKHVETLGTYSHGSFEGTISISKVGSAVSVFVGPGSAKIQVDDDHHTGRFMGMHALGSWTGNAPRVTYFEGGNN